MKRTIALGGVLAAFMLVAPQTHAQVQQPSAPPPGAGSASGKFCLQPKAGGSPRCLYQTIADCQIASKQGSEGNCVQNPGTTGAGGIKQ